MEGSDDAVPSIIESQGDEKVFRRNWARLIQKIYDLKMAIDGYIMSKLPPTLSVTLSGTCGIKEWEEYKAVFPNESMRFGIVERSPMPRSFLRAPAGQAKSAETKILSAQCPASNRFVPDEDVDLNIINYMLE